MIFKANSSINLALDVKGKNETGYHDVDLVSIPLDLHDIIEVKPLIGSRDTYLTEDDPTIICEETEMAYKAFSEMKKRFNLNRGIRIQIYKRIPPEAGLAGGYADAAAIISALCRTYRISLEDPRVIEACSAIGAGVNLALAKIPARATGTHEIVEPLTDLDFRYGVLLVKPREGLDAGTVYQAYDALPESQKIHADIPGLLKALESHDEDAIGQRMINSLLTPAIHMCPAIEDILDEMSNLGFKMKNMSASGTACFCLSKDREQLRKARRKFDSQGYATLLTSTIIKH